MGVAIHNHLDTKKYFPTAGSNPQAFTAADGTTSTYWNLAAKYGFERGSWCFQLLPYTEETGLFDVAHQSNVDGFATLPALGKSVYESRFKPMSAHRAELERQLQHPPAMFGRSVITPA